MPDKFVVQHGSGYIDHGASRRHQNDCQCEECRSMQPPKGVLGTQQRRDDDSPLLRTRGVLGRMADESKNGRQ